MYSWILQSFRKLLMCVRSYHGRSFIMLCRKTLRIVAELEAEEQQLSEESSCSDSDTYQATDSLSSEEESSPGPSASTRTEKDKAKDLYLKGKSRKSYCKSLHLESSFEETDQY